MRANNSTTTTVRLRSSIEQDIVEVSQAAARHSRFIADYLDSLHEEYYRGGGRGDGGAADDDEAANNNQNATMPIPEAIEIPRSSTAALEKVVEFLEHYEECPMMPMIEPDGGNIPNTFALVVLQEYYRSYVETMQPEIFWQVRVLSNFMEIDQLNVLVNVWLTCQIYGSPEERIAELLQIPPMTDEELRHARSTQSWMFEDDGGGTPNNGGGE
jgi:hypothetical protein